MLKQGILNPQILSLLARVRRVHWHRRLVRAQPRATTTLSPSAPVRLLRLQTRPPLVHLVMSGGSRILLLPSMGLTRSPYISSPLRSRRPRPWRRRPRHQPRERRRLMSIRPSIMARSDMASESRIASTSRPTYRSSLTAAMGHRRISTIKSDGLGCRLSSKANSV